jgi:hypothetical protein
MSLNYFQKKIFNGTNVIYYLVFKEQRLVEVYFDLMIKSTCRENNFHFFLIFLSLKPKYMNLQDKTHVENEQFS